MPVIPHNFPMLRGIGNREHRKSVLLIGAGMSYGLIPSPPSLLEQKRTNAEIVLRFNASLSSTPPLPWDYLYKWADEVYNHLSTNGSRNPKLELAKSLNITTDTCWHGCVSPARNTPRHRVIARFARESLWEQIWSLNWDCIQESALENVGIKHDGTDEMLPWPTVFRTFITAQDCAGMGETASVKVIKPHGCVNALEKAEEYEKSGHYAEALTSSKRFLITETELNSLDTTTFNTGTQQFIFASLCEKLSSHPFVIAGWKVSEQYLLDYMQTNICPNLTDRHSLPDDELSIIDVTFNSEGHTRLAGFYGKGKNNVHIDVNQANLDTDVLFLWLQSLYAVDCLDLWANDSDKPAIQDIRSRIENPPDDQPFVIQWADNLLPVWVRLCWRCGLVECIRGDSCETISIDDIHLESRDEHIPWTIRSISRPELKAAARLLAGLINSSHGDKWDYKTFPGGLYQNTHLVIPVPAWGDKPNDLQGLRPLIDSIKTSGAGKFDKLSVLFLTPDSSGNIDNNTKNELKEIVAREISLPRFAKGSDINEITLGDL